MPVTTLGRQLIKQVLPQEYKSMADAPLTAAAVDQLTTQLARKYPEQYVDILDSLDRFAQSVVSGYGRQTSIPLRDVQSGAPVKAYVNKIQQLIKSILNDSKLTNAQKQQQIVNIGYRYSDKIKDAVVADHRKRNTSLWGQLSSGTRGNAMVVTQLNVGNLGVRDAMNRDMPYFGVSPYAAGASPFAYWVGASSSRKGFYDTQALTGRAGYLGKQAANATHNVPIIETDCGTQNTGIAVPADNNAVGAMLLRPYKNYPAGTIVTEQVLKNAKDDDRLIVRSPLTCQSKHGVCAYCSGLDQNNKLPAIGSYVALNAAKTFIEKATQAGVGSKHVGGTGGKKNLDPQGEDQPTGMDALQRLFYVPSTFKGAAVLSPEDGYVSDIRKAPQGGHYITVGVHTVYAPQARTVSVKQGEKVTAGDKLTNGVPNPAKVVQYKGLGEGRRYFVQVLDDTLKKNKWGVNRRNLQQFTRGFLDRVRITAPDGVGQYLPGDVVNYDIVQKQWVPRSSAKKQAVQDSLNMYLQQPVLHYTIGTRITPAVRDTLKKYKFDQVVVNKEPLPFQPLFVRSQDIMANDENWLPRLMGQRLTSTLFEAARKGITDRYDSPSYVDRVVASPYKPQG